VGWVIFLAIAVPLLAVVAWVLFSDSLVHVAPGQLGLLLVRGKATDRALEPGPHWVPAIRRRMMQPYPSLELSLRTGRTDALPTSSLEWAGPAPVVTLGDRVSAVVGYTVRFRLDQTRLRVIHNRFGPDGIWAAVGDETARTVRTALASPSVRVDDLFGDARRELERHIGDAVTAALAELGFIVTRFSLADVDLGRTGDVIQAIGRARHDLERELADQAVRVTRAKVDADLLRQAATLPVDTPIRYRELEAWDDAVRALGFVHYATSPRPTAGAAPTEDAAEGQA
jgi:regulator of protease activity HflC (stomatin/prohibitin superfamily)